MRERRINQSDMAVLINKSIDKKYPYYFRFRYSIEKSCFFAKPIRKDGRGDSSIELDENSPLAKAFEMIEANKQRLGVNSWVTI